MGNTIVTFGEILGRLDMPDHRKFAQNLPGDIRFTFAGSEANVAVSIAYMGKNARFVTALPDNEIGDACVRTLRGFGVDVSEIKRDSGRLGLYYVEGGANQRASKIIYDREHSAISLADADMFDYDRIFRDAAWFHISGITPALSKTAADTALRVCREAKKRGITVSCDLNYRKKLWKWDSSLSPKELARKTMPGILENVDLLIANEEDSGDILDIRADATDISRGEINCNGYIEVARKITGRFPQIRTVATTLRESISASHNNWGAMLYDKRSDTAHFAPNDTEGGYAPYPIRNIVDRVGGGDSFAAALIFALNTTEHADPAAAVRFAAAASCLCHTICGDFNLSSRSDVELLMAGDGSGRVQR